MKICFIIPFFYKWNNYANVKSNFEYLQKMGYQVDLFSKKYIDKVIFEEYDIVMLHGSGTSLTEQQYKECKDNNIIIWSFGWSDPNLFNQVHYDQGDIYFTNDLKLSSHLDKAKFYNTSCDKRYHVDLKLDKKTDILVYGTGNHKFVTNRNEVVNKLRKLGFCIKVFGRGWEAHQDTFSFIEGEALAKEICKAHIVLDITNEGTAWSHRIFEASARATPVITLNREDTCKFFEPGKEIFIYDTFEQLVLRLKYLLSNTHKLKEVGLNAQKRCYEEHDISIRIKQLDKIIKETI